MPMTQASPTAPTGTTWACFPSRRPAIAVNRKPASGSAMMSGTSVSNIRRSLPHRVVLVDERRPLVAEDREDDRESDRRLARRDRHDEERDHRARGPRVRPGFGHERGKSDE